MFQKFWESIARDLEEEEGSAPSTWRKNRIETYFLPKLDERVIRLCENDKLKKQRCGKLKDKDLISGYNTFLRYFHDKNYKGGTAKTRHIYAIYVGADSYEDYCNNNGITMISKKKNSGNIYSETQLSSHSLRQKILEYYQNNPEYNFISLLGSQQTDIQKFPMEKFFIDLSYIDKDEISRQEDLMLNEKESYQQKNIRRVLFHNALPHDFISDDILIDHQRLVILGIPGAGKSTFANWLCWNWANKNNEGKEQILIHINIRTLRFASINCIAEYVNRKISPNKNINQIFDCLKNEHYQFLFLLDGLDEITNDKKSILWEDINAISKGCKYIVFTRPYGMINQNFDYQLTFEIIGFNTTTREHYLNNFLVDNEADISTEKLVEILDDNPVLKDFSFNPLMLSYIVLICHIHGSRAEQVLNNIESAYELQDQLLGWLRQYYNTKTFKRSFDELLIESQNFAYEMEVKQLFLYESKNRVDKYSVTTELLAQLGLGNKENLKKDYWNFHFNTITFQEFLAANFIGDKINANAILYLLKNQLQWNFARMLIGYASLHKKEKLIDSILKTLSHLFEKTKHRFYQHLYLYLLGELKKSLLNNYADNAFLAKMLDNYIKTPTDSNWESLLLESIGRIYSKLHPLKQEIFNQLILKELDLVLQKVYFRDLSSGMTRFTNRLITRLYLHQNEKFVKQFLVQVKDYVIAHHKTNLLLIKDKSNKQLQELGMRQNNRIIGLLRMTTEIDENILSKNKNLLLQIVEHLSPNAIEESILLKSISYSELEIWDSLIHNKEKVGLGENIPDIKQRTDTETLIINQANNIYHFSMSCYVFALSIKRHRKDPSSEFLNIIQYLKGILIEKFDQEEGIGYFTNAVEQLTCSVDFLVKTMECLQPKVPMNEVLDVIYTFELENEISFIDDNHFQNFIEKKIEQLLIKYNTDDFERLINIFSNTKNGQNSFSKFRQNIFDLFKQFVKTEEHKLNHAYDGFQANNFIHSYNQAINIVDDFQDILEYEYDKKFFIDKILEHDLQHNTYLKIDLLPKLFGHRFAFYDKQYWQFLESLIDKNQAIFKVFYVLSGSWSFSFKSNLKYIDRIWEKAVTVIPENNTDIGVNAVIIFQSAYRSLKVYKQFECPSFAGKLPENIAAVLNNKNLKLEAVKGTQIFSELLSYSLLQKYITSRDCLLLKSYQEVIDDSPYGYEIIIPEAAELFTIEELEGQESLFGTQLYQETINYIMEHSVIETSFQQKEFEELLKS